MILKWMVKLFEWFTAYDPDFSRWICNERDSARRAIQELDPKGPPPPDLSIYLSAPKRRDRDDEQT